jgi:hypothetical protein
VLGEATFLPFPFRVLFVPTLGAFWEFLIGGFCVFTVLTPLPFFPATAETGKQK